MTNQEFKERVQPLSRRYKGLFGYVPDIGDYNCTREEFVVALTKAIMEEREISCFLAA